MWSERGRGRQRALFGVAAHCGWAAGPQQVWAAGLVGAARAGHSSRICQLSFLASIINHSERRQVSWPRNLQLHDLDEKSWYRPTNSIYAAPWYGILNRFRKFYNSPNSESEFFDEFEKRYFLVQFYFLPEQKHHIHRNRICSLEFCIRHLTQNRHTEF